VVHVFHLQCHKCTGATLTAEIYGLHANALQSGNLNYKLISQNSQVISTNY